MFILLVELVELETILPYLKLTANAPENGWLEDDPFPLGRLGLFSEAKTLVSGRVYVCELSRSRADTNKIWPTMKAEKTCTS